MMFFRRRETETDSAFSGRWGEEAAACYLERKKYKVLGRRVRVGRRDEIDVVARWGEVLVFVEVKTRRGESFGRPLDFVDRKKRQALSRAAVRYLARVPNPRVPFRFDVIEIVGAPGVEPEIRHIENAFSLDRRYVLPC